MSGYVNAFFGAITGSTAILNSLALAQEMGGNFQATFMKGLAESTWKYKLTNAEAFTSAASKYESWMTTSQAYTAEKAIGGCTLSQKEAVLNSYLQHHTLTYSDGEGHVFSVTPTSLASWENMIKAGGNLAIGGTSDINGAFAALAGGGGNYTGGFVTPTDTSAIKSLMNIEIAHSVMNGGNTPFLNHNYTSATLSQIGNHVNALTKAKQTASIVQNAAQTYQTAKTELSQTINTGQMGISQEQTWVGTTVQGIGLVTNQLTQFLQALANTPTITL